MNIQLRDLEDAVRKKKLTKQQMEQIVLIAKERGASDPSFGFINLLYYLGALIVIGAMGMFMTIGWESFGGGGVCAISIAYAAAFATAGHVFWSKKSMKAAGGLLVTMAVCMTPLAVYGLERALGVWPMDDPGKYQGFHVWINGSWLVMEIATVIAAVIALAFVRFPFLTMPIAFSLWYMSMDLVPFVMRREDFSWDERKLVSVFVGLAMIAASYIADRRTKEDFSFWGYLFGAIAFWGGLSLMDSSSELNKFLYCMLNVLLMLVSVWLSRRVFMVFGALGVFGYLGYLSYDVFQDSMMFPFALSLLGILLIVSAVIYQKNQKRIESFFERAIPRPLKKFRPISRA